MQEQTTNWPMAIKYQKTTKINYPSDKYNINMNICLQFYAIKSKKKRKLLFEKILFINTTAARGWKEAQRLSLVHFIINFWIYIVHNPID